MRAKAFVRRMGHADGAGWPTPPTGKMASSADLEKTSRFLAEVSSDAEDYRLGRLSSTARIFASYLNETDVFVLNDFDGERRVGYGPCGRCSMVFASAPLISLDDTYLFPSERDNETIHLPEFNFALCPFCGHRARVNAPVMFYSDARHQVIYCLPAHMGLGQEEAPEAYRRVIQEIRENYGRRVSGDAASRFDKAPELVTYNIPDFLYAIQMGDLAREAHVALLTRFPDGSGSIVDKTKKVVIDLAPEELAEYWAHEEPATASRGDLDEGGEDMGAAMFAFEEGRLEEARDMLEALARQRPKDRFVLRNLGVVYAALGDKTRAREVLRLLPVGSPWRGRGA